MGKLVCFSFCPKLNILMYTLLNKKFVFYIQEAPSQTSSGDCGVFIIVYAKVLIHGGKLKKMKVCTF